MTYLVEFQVILFVKCRAELASQEMAGLKRTGPGSLLEKVLAQATESSPDLNRVTTGYFLGKVRTTPKGSFLAARIRIGEQWKKVALAVRTV